MKKFILFFALFCGWLGFAFGQNVYTSKISPTEAVEIQITQEGETAIVSRKNIAWKQGMNSSLFNTTSLIFEGNLLNLPAGDYWFVPTEGKAIRIGSTTLTNERCECKTLTATNANDCLIRTLFGNTRFCDGTICTCCNIITSGAGFTAKGGGVIIQSQFVTFK